jgi:hypothetical protein
VLQVKECALTFSFSFFPFFHFGTRIWDSQKIWGVLMSFRLMMLVVLLCFCWVHFWWCVCVCANVLMDINQESKGEDEDKRRCCVQLTFLFCKS